MSTSDAKDSKSNGASETKQKAAGGGMSSMLKFVGMLVVVIAYALVFLVPGHLSKNGDKVDVVSADEPKKEEPPATKPTEKPTEEPPATTTQAPPKVEETTTEAPPPPEKKKESKKAEKPAEKKKEKPEPPKPKKKKKSSADYLDLAMRLAQATELASGLQQAGQLDSDAATTLNKEISEIEEGINDLDDSIARDLKAMVSVVRGTMLQKTEGLSDDQVEALGDSYTYANARYWDDYYNKTDAEERFDWYGSWDSKITQKTADGETETLDLGDLLRPHIASVEKKILMLGCGNSDMSTKMYSAGYEDIVNIDISPKLLDELRAQHETTMPNMKWLFMNVSALEFEDASFDIVLDKGTLDAIEQNGQLLTEAVKEVHRVLKPDGKFLSTTYNDRSIRVERQLQGTSSWGDCETQTFQKVAHKKVGGSEEDRNYFVHACGRS